MKKLILILLASFMCLSLTACQGNDANKAEAEARIIGRWAFEERDTAFRFYDDHTGKMSAASSEEVSKSLRWSYDVDAEAYLIYIEGKDEVIFVAFDEDGNFVYSGETFEKVE